MLGGKRSVKAYANIVLQPQKGDSEMNRSLSIVLIVCFCFEALWAGVDSQKTVYVGGTVSSIKEQTEGVSSTSDEKVFLFDYGKGKLQIPYDRIESLEYGQKVGRRGGIVSRWVITKKRKHFLTIGYKDENSQQHLKFAITQSRSGTMANRGCPTCT